ncbi:type I polyketide synthase [Altericroceibacterium xinjiangense]|uniref:type I polyketide synthase n=1 Tax=Altericroceibacterium xinjiangense TaxID=762261 RepID=UPI000F7E57BB|nr:type I polyketide synthase [Altericroceibacterium xinjiangense]
MHQPFGSFDGPTPIADSSIAIVGMSCRFANVRNLAEYWALLRDGKEAIETYSDEQLIEAGVSPALLRNPNYVRRGAPLADMECFDAALFGLSPRDASIMDPQHRHFLECSWEALENAGHTPQGFDGVIGVFAGSGHNAYMPYNLLTNGKLVNDIGLFLLRHTSNDKDFLTTRASYLLDLKGPSINVQTACSTSLVSIHMAAQSLLSGECDMALAGGASIELPHRHGYLYEEGEILSPDGHCRPFDGASQGTVFGSGVAVLALRRLEDAIASGDHIHAVLRGSAINNDGAGKVGYLAPSVDGQAKVIAEALAVADIDPATIDYIEAHGTGTPIGDPIEVAALTQVFQQSSGSEGQCAIGSVKANIGHTDTAAGAAGVIKVALAMTHGELPGIPNFETPNPACFFAGSPFRVQAERAPWTRSEGRPRRAGVSSLGVGGTNAHVVLEEAPPRAASGSSRRRQVLLCSGKTETAANANAEALARHLEEHPGTSLADAAFTLTLGRQHLSARRFAVAKTDGDAAAALRTASDRPVAQQTCIPGRPVAFLFCGAGPQHIDMARGLYETEPGFRADVDRALALADGIGVANLRRWLFPADADREQAMRELARPSVALPALFIVQTALAKLWISLGIEPGAMIGHSSGEYAAAHISGVIGLEAGLRIVHSRGRLFETTREGGMISVPLSEEELAPLLPADLSIAAINAPRLCVVSGAAEAIARFHRVLQEQDIEAQLVPISVAAHSPMLDPILAEFRVLMRTIDYSAPKIPFASNLTGEWVKAEEATDPEYWVRHLREPVRFTDGLQRLLDDPERVLLEVGPGRSMTSLARQHPARKPSQPVVNSMRHPDQAMEDDARFLEALGELWSLGVTVDWKAFWGDEQRLRIPLPTYRFDRQRHWIEPGAALAMAGPGEDADVRQDIADWGYEPVWLRADLPGTERTEGPALVLADDGVFGQNLEKRLRQNGTDVITVRAGRRFRRVGADVFTVRPDERTDWAQLFDCLGAESRLPKHVYHCWLVTGSGPKPDNQRLINLGLHCLATMTPELAGICEGRIGFALVTDKAQRVGGDRDVMPIKATALGAARAVSAEFPDLCVRSIDIDLLASDGPQACGALVDAVVDEIAASGDQRDVALRAGERWVLEHKPVRSLSGDQTASPARLRPRGTYLITGGLGGLGLTIAQYLAETCDARLALVSRTELPPKERWADLLARGVLPAEVEERIRKLVALEAAGAEVEIIVADVADWRALRRGIRRIADRFNPVTGVFHAAGAIDDGLIETKTRESIEAVLRPKVAGTLALEKALQGFAPDFMMLFSSISAFAGIPGQVDYAAANAFLDSYAQAGRADPATRVLSVGWSQWAEVGMAAELNRRNGSSTLPHDDLGEGKPVDHPFLERVHTLSEDEIVVTGTLTPQRDWVLREHRIVGAGALLPGTGYLELARAADALFRNGSAEFSDFTFLKPFAVPDGSARELRVHFRRRSGSSWRVAILGRPLDPEPGEWVEHACGRVRGNDAPPFPPILDLGAIAARCKPGTGGGADQPMLQFGPRWNNLTQALIGQEEALLRLDLPEEFHDDLDRVRLHPALLDFATAGAQALIPDRVASRDFFAPFSYRRFVQHAPFPARIVSHVRYRPGAEASGLTAAFDVTITDSEGQVLAEISEFTMMRVQDAGLLSLGQSDKSAPDAAPAAVRTIRHAEGILPEEGVEVVARILRQSPKSHLIVSPYALGPVLSRLRAPPASPRMAANGDSADLPITETEQLIADLWRDLLGIEAVGRHDNFFDLGGHSLLAVQFTNRLRKKIGRALPLAAMLDQPTVANLAGILDPDNRNVSAEAAMEQGSPSAPAKGIVTIRGGGALTPIFFVHDGLGETLLYRGLALRLDPERPVLGLEPLRTADGNYAHTRIDQMAANYIERMRTVQPFGPYLLAGLCAGGVIAFEMARQLQDAGERVAFVGIIDAADTQATKVPFLATWRRIAGVQTSLSEVSPAGIVPDLGRRAWKMARWEVGSRIRRAHDRRTVRQLRLNRRVEAATASFAPSIPFLKLYEVAHREHRPSGLFEGGAVALFKASDETGQVDDTPYGLIYSDYALGWGKRIQEDMMIVPVPGGHSSVLQEPHVATLAPLFQKALEDALAGVHPWDERELESESFDPVAVAAE